MKTYQLKSRSQQRTGAVVPLMAFVISVLLIVLAISINTNWMMFSKTAEQSAADLASISTLNYFSQDLSKPNNISDSRGIGEEILQLNRGGTGQGDRIKFGYLSGSNAHDPVFSEDESDIEAVKVELDNANKVPLFMGGFLGRDDVAISAEATSVFQAVEVVLAIDASRSMNRRVSSNNFPEGASSIHERPRKGSRWFVLVDAMGDFLAAVKDANPNTRIALVTFGGGRTGHTVESPLDETEARLEIPLESIQFSDDFMNLVNSYKDYPALGLGTYISDAIDTSLDELLRGNVRAKRFVILLSDGDQYTFDDVRPTPGEAAQHAVANNIKIHTINFQRDANPQLLEASTVSGGLNFEAGDTVALKAAFTDLVRQFRLRLAD